MGPKRSRAKRYDEDFDEYVSSDSDYETNAAVRARKWAIDRARRRYLNSNSALADGHSDVYADFTDLKLKPDHVHRPIYVTKDNLIILEAFSPLYLQAYDFLVAIAEPESRPEFVHRYRLTKNSLYAAVAMSIDADTIIRVLNRLCKTDLPMEAIRFIRQETRTFGQAKLVLRENNQYFIESTNPDVLRELLRHRTISQARIVDASVPTSGDDFEQVATLSELAQNTLFDENTLDADDDSDDEGEGSGLVGASSSSSSALGVKTKAPKKTTVTFRIRNECVQEVKRTAQAASYPLMEEYDFRSDKRNANVDINIKPTTKIRSYQEKSLSKMFGNGRARSGLIVLPCGAGKSLTGVIATSTVKKSTMILCINNASVTQWKEQLLMWTSIQEKDVKLFTSDYKDFLPPVVGNVTPGCIVVSTFSMICHSGQRSADGARMMADITSREWGLIVLDEVHVAPARMFRRVLDLVNAHCKLGLTATLVREDNKIDDLVYLVGPKLYEANWTDLTQQGYLASVQCIEVWCPMTPEFYKEYLKYGNYSNINSVGGMSFASGNTMGSSISTDDDGGSALSAAHVKGKSRIQQMLYILNPTKFKSAEYLLAFHRKRGDKVILFSDDVPALILYCEHLKIPYIFGETPGHEREAHLHAFRTEPAYDALGLSKVGDTALDIPEASVIIQVSSHFGARRQETQRLGRILRPKANPTGGFNAFFYTLVSTDTREMFYSAKRQQYLVDQGYTFKIIQDLLEVASADGYKSVLLNTKKAEIDLLNKVLAFKNVERHDESEKRAVIRETLSLGGDGNEDISEYLLAQNAEEGDHVPSSRAKLTGAHG